MKRLIKRKNINFLYIQIIEILIFCVRNIKENIQWVGFYYICIEKQRVINKDMQLLIYEYMVIENVFLINRRKKLNIINKRFNKVILLSFFYVFERFRGEWGVWMCQQFVFFILDVCLFFQVFSYYFFGNRVLVFSYRNLFYFINSEKFCYYQEE